MKNRPKPNKPMDPRLLELRRKHVERGNKIGAKLAQSPEDLAMFFGVVHDLVSLMERVGFDFASGKIHPNAVMIHQQQAIVTQQHPKGKPVLVGTIAPSQICIALVEMWKRLGAEEGDKTDGKEKTTDDTPEGDQETTDQEQRECEQPGAGGNIVNFPASGVAGPSSDPDDQATDI